MSLELSGIFYRFKKQTVAIEDLPEEELDKIISEYTDEEKTRTIKHLVQVLRELK